MTICTGAAGAKVPAWHSAWSPVTELAYDGRGMYWDVLHVGALEMLAALQRNVFIAAFCGFLDLAAAIG